jgi:hypothetical protein
VRLYRGTRRSGLTANSRVHRDAVTDDPYNVHPDVDAEDPGLDLQDWETRYQQLLPDLADDPISGLPELADLIEEALTSSGYALDDEVAEDGQAPDVVREFHAAREISDRVERGEDIDPGDVGQAIEGLRALYDHISTNRAG